MTLPNRFALTDLALASSPALDRPARSRAARLLTPAWLAALSLTSATSAQQVPFTVIDTPDSGTTQPPLAHIDLDLATLHSDFFSVPPPTAQPGPFLPRAPLTLYSRFAATAQGNNLWGPGGNPAGSGTQPDIVFDDVNIPVARLVDMMTSAPCTVVTVDRVKFTVRRGAAAPAGTINLFWTTFDSRLNPAFLNATLRTPYDVPPESLHQFASVPFAATAGALTSTFTVGDGVAPLFTVPLHMNSVQVGGVPASLGSFAIGWQIVAPTYTTSNFQVWLSTTGTSGVDGVATLGDPNANVFIYYDSDLCTPERSVGFTSPNVAAFTLDVHGTPIVSATPTACCLPSAAGAVCFVADSADNCLQCNGVVVAPAQTTCSPNPCVQSVCCNPLTGVCGFFVGSVCTDGRVDAMSTTCTPNPCTPATAPANNECGGAIPLVLGVPRIGESMAGATNSFAAGSSACAFFTSGDVWYSYTTDANAPADGIYLVRAVPSPTSGLNVQQQLVIKAYANVCPIPSVATTFDCFDSACATGDLTFTAGPNTTILFSVQAQSTAPSTLFSIRIDSVNTRACCSAVTGLCILSDSTGACTDPAYPNQGAVNSTCTPNTCPPPPTGACCAASGDCQVVTTGACTLSGGIYQGDNASCTAPTNPCPQPIVCCTGAACTFVLLTTCTTGGGALNAAPSCAPSPCGGACCANDGSCSLTTLAACTTNFLGLGTGCTGPTNPCPQPQTGICCQSDGSCTAATPGLPDPTCATGTVVAGGTCTPNTCPPPIGICCTANACTFVADIPDAFACTSGGGTFNGTLMTCTPNPCAPPQGVCCRGSTCIVDAALQSQAACAAAVTGAAGAKFVATGPCGGANHLAPCCHADYTKNNIRDVGDIFAFLGDWFANRPWAITGGNGTGIPGVPSIFAFLGDWFAGGCP